MEAAAVTRERLTEAAQEAAFEAFFLDTCQRVVAMVAVATGEVAAAEDAVQEAYARAFVRWQRVGTLDRPDLWVAHVAGRIAIDSWRRQRHDVELDAAVPAEALHDIERLQLRWGIDTLSPMQRMTVILRHARGLPVADVAEAVQTSPETVKTHLQRALRRLRTLLREDGHE